MTDTLFQGVWPKVNRKCSRALFWPPHWAGGIVDLLDFNLEGQRGGLSFALLIQGRPRAAEEPSGRRRRGRAGLLGGTAHGGLLVPEGASSRRRSSLRPRALFRPLPRLWLAEELLPAPCLFSSVRLRPHRFEHGSCPPLPRETSRPLEGAPSRWKKPAAHPDEMVQQARSPLSSLQPHHPALTPNPKPLVPSP